MVTLLWLTYSRELSKYDGGITATIAFNGWNSISGKGCIGIGIY